MTLPRLRCVAASFFLAVVGVAACRSQRPITTDPYPTLPFRPEVTYDSWNVSIRNPEQESYLNTTLRLYVGGTLYTMPVGTIQPGETVAVSLLNLTNEHGERFSPDSVQISELEVRADFRGHEVHKDFPPPN